MGSLIKTKLYLRPVESQCWIQSIIYFNLFNISDPRKGPGILEVRERLNPWTSDSQCSALCSPTCFFSFYPRVARLRL